MPLDKNSGLRTIGVGKVLRRVAGKAVISIVNDDVTKTVGNLFKLECELKTAEIFDNINIKITSSGQSHIGVVIGSKLYRKEYIK